MIPQPPSPSREAFLNRTNVHNKSSLSDRKRVFQSDSDLTNHARKRVRLEGNHEVNTPVIENIDGYSSSEDDSDVVAIPRPPWTRSIYSMHSALLSSSPSTLSRLQYPSTRPILESFVSSHKADMFKCHSVDINSFTSIPYACSYSNNAKRGGSPLLSVATEQGVVYILDTRKREDWDCEPQRISFQPFANGIFDVHWSPDDTLLATASADRTVHISSLESTGVKTIRQLHGHKGTVKCVSWDPSRNGDILCSGGRDGGICVWDLRVGKDIQSPEDVERGSCSPVIVIARAHDGKEQLTKSRPRKGKLPPATLRSITSLVFSPTEPLGLISSGSTDGILRYWDLRLPILTGDSTRSKKAAKTKISSLITSTDPTTYQNTRRSRGISSLSLGSGPSAYSLFALANDSRVHTFNQSTLEPLSGWSFSKAKDQAQETILDNWSYGHDEMRTNSFYVRAATSPCGSWLASGGAEKGSVFLFDISGGAESRFRSTGDDMEGDGTRRAVQLRGQTGEVGAVDWAQGMLASCADDGTVRIWRPDIEVYRRCRENAESMRWDWSWSTNA